MRAIRLKAKTLYLEGETEIGELAKEVGTSTVSIWRWMQADKKAGHEWVCRKDIRNAVVSDITKRVTAKVAEETGNSVAAELIAIGEASRIAAAYVKDILEKAKAGKIVAGEKQSQADVFNTVMMGYSRFASTVREDHGIRAGQASIPADVGSDTKFEFVVVRDEEVA